jgi:hypothetical protein
MMQLEFIGSLEEWFPELAQAEKERLRRRAIPKRANRFIRNLMFFVVV